MIVTWFTQCLPVALIPEQLLVSSVWNDVIHNRRLHIPAALQALCTQRMSLQEQHPCLPSPAIIPALCGCFRVPRMQFPVFFTVLLSRRHEIRTSWMFAWDLWTVWHRILQVSDYSSHPGSDSRAGSRNNNVSAHPRTRSHLVS